MRKDILVIEGDGVGLEVVAAAKEVLEKATEKCSHHFKYENALMGHIAIENEGSPISAETIKKAHSADAILFGAIGHPLYDNNPSLKVRPEQGLLTLRKELNLYINLRPIRTFEMLLEASPFKKDIVLGIDILFFRELTGGIYFGEKKRGLHKQSASDLMEYTKEEIERIAHPAMQAAQRRNKKLCSVDKANVLESSRLWRETVQEIAKDYPDVEVSHMFVDNAAMQLIKNPRQFDVVLTSNLFGDILTDEASQIVGSLGMLPSASLGRGTGLYEPVHGSAPAIANQNIANPLASILSVALMLDYSFNLKEEGKSIIKAVEKTLLDGYRTKDIAVENTLPQHILGTTEITEKIIRNINN